MSARLRRRRSGAWALGAAVAALALCGCFDFAKAEALCLSDGGCRPGEGQTDGGSADSGAPANAGFKFFSDAGTPVCTASGWCWLAPRPTGATITSLLGVGPDEFWMGTSAQGLIHVRGEQQWSVTPPFETPQTGPTPFTALTVDPEGALLAAGWRGDDRMVTSRIDPATGQVTPFAIPVELGLQQRTRALATCDGTLLVAAGGVSPDNSRVVPSLTEGTSWQAQHVVPLPTSFATADGLLLGAACGAGGQAWAVGTSGAVLQRSPDAGWRMLPTPSAADLELRAVVGLNGGFAVAGTGYVGWYEAGAGWHHLSTEPGVSWEALAVSPDQLVAAGHSSDRAQVCRWTVLEGRVQSSALCTPHDAVGGTSAQGLNAATTTGATVLVGGQRGLVARLGPAFAEARLTSGTQSSLRAVTLVGGLPWAAGDDDVVLLPDGDGGLAVRKTGRGDTWRSIAPALGGGVLLAGEGGNLVRMGPGPGAVVTDVARTWLDGGQEGLPPIRQVASNHGQVWAIADQAVFRWVGPDVMQEVPGPADPGTLTSVAVSPVGEVYVGADQPWTLGDAGFEPLLPAAPSSAWLDVKAPAAGLVTALGRDQGGQERLLTWSRNSLDAGVSVECGGNRSYALSAGGDVVMSCGSDVLQLSSGWTAELLAGPIPHTGTATNLEAVTWGNGCFYLAGEGVSLLRKCAP